MKFACLHVVSDTLEPFATLRTIQPEETPNISEGYEKTGRAPASTCYKQRKRVIATAVQFGSKLFETTYVLFVFPFVFCARDGFWWI